MIFVGKLSYYSQSLSDKQIFVLMCKRHLRMIILAKKADITKFVDQHHARFCPLSPKHRKMAFSKYYSIEVVLSIVAFHG